MESRYYDGSMQVLLLEDEPIFHEIWRYVLKNVDESAELVCVDSVEKAEQLISTLDDGINTFRLVISDIYLSGVKSGIDFWNEVFLTDEPVPPFLLVSSLSVAHLLKGLKEAWAVPKYIQKPFDPAECYPLIKTLLARKAPVPPP